jgi:hypothetical protein
MADAHDVVIFLEQKRVDLSRRGYDFYDDEGQFLFPATPHSSVLYIINTRSEYRVQYSLGIDLNMSISRINEDIEFAIASLERDRRPRPEPTWEWHWLDREIPIIKNYPHRRIKPWAAL